MPIYMDRHDVSEKVTAEIVAQLHQQDLKIQHNFQCRGLTYWFDDRRKTAFCLIEAPNKEAIEQMHGSAHGEVPNEIIEVDPLVVESFLGRISDPKQAGDGPLNIISESALRTLMMVGFDDWASLHIEKTETNVNVPACMNLLVPIFHKFGGRVVKTFRTSYLVSFQSVTQTILCALELYSGILKWEEKTKCAPILLKTGISAGVPVSGKQELFEEAEKEARMLHYISEANIVVSSEVKGLYEEENPDAYLEHELFVSLSPSDQKFLFPLMDYIAETWQNPYLKVDDLGKNLGYSKSQFYRKMVSLVGETPNNFIKNYRLRKAAKRIRRQSGNIAEIAYETGFNSPSYFSKCFLRKYGILPSEYLQQALA